MPYSMMWGTGFEMRTNEIFHTADRNSVVIRTGTSSAHTGDCYADLSDSGDYFYLRPGGYHYDLYFGMWVRLFTDQDFDIYFYNQDGNYARLRYLYTTGYWNFYVGSTLTATSSIRTEAGTQGGWQNVQIRLKVSTTGDGVFQLKLNGYLAISFIGQTMPGSNNFYDYIKVMDTTFIDDITFGSGSWPGDIRFDKLEITGNSTPQDWGFTGSSSAWRAISPDLFTTASYITTSTNAQTSMFQLQDWNSFNKIPKAVVAWARAIKAEATLDYVRLMCRTSDMATGSLQLLDPGGAFMSEIFATDPGDDGAWSATGINMTEIGVQSYYTLG